MSLDFNILFPDLDSFDPSSKVWVYFSDRKFSNEEAVQIQKRIDQFCLEWTSHGAKVKSKGYLAFHRVIVLVADETQAGVSGCSTDSSVRFMKSIERDFLTNLMNREFFFYLDEEGIVYHHPIDKIIELKDNTIMVFNPFFKDLNEFRTSWLSPLMSSKYKRFV